MSIQKNSAWKFTTVIFLLVILVGVSTPHPAEAGFFDFFRKIFNPNATSVGQGGTLDIQLAPRTSAPTPVQIEQHRTLERTLRTNEEVVNGSETQPVSPVPLRTPTQSSIDIKPRTITKTEPKVEEQAEVRTVSQITNIGCQNQAPINVASPVNNGILNIGGYVTVTWQWCNIAPDSQVSIRLVNENTKIAVPFIWGSNNKSGYYRSSTYGGSDFFIIPETTIPGYYRAEVEVVSSLEKRIIKGSSGVFELKAQKERPTKTETKTESAVEEIPSVEPTKNVTQETAVDGCELNAITGNVACQYSEVAMVQNSNGKMVAKVNLNPRTTKAREACFEVHFKDEVSGWLFNVGDSATNNGWAGDASTQSNDSEFHISSGSNNGGFGLYASDHVNLSDTLDGHRQLSSDSGIDIRSGIADICVSNENIEVDFKGPHGSYSKNVNHYSLFALNGQSDSQGPVNYDLYIGINRVIGSLGRVGDGVGKVIIKLN